MYRNKWKGREMGRQLKGGWQGKRQQAWQGREAAEKEIVAE